ncbi:MAG: hypothetical protein ACAI25_09465 [Planctomycetota bacterium]
MSEDELRFGLAVALPAVTAGVLLLLVRRPCAGALAAALGAVVAVLVLFAPAKLVGPAAPAAPLLALVALGGAGVGLVPPGKVRVALLAALAAMTPVVGLWLLSEENMPRSTKLLWGAGEAVAVFLGALSLDVWSGRREGAGRPVVLWVLAAGGAVAVAREAYPSGGMLVAGMAAVLGALAVFAWWKPVEGRFRAAVPAVATVLAGSWLVAHHMNDFRPVETGLLLGAPLLVWAGELAPKGKSLVSGVAVLAPVAVAVYLAFPKVSALGY